MNMDHDIKRRMLHQAVQDNLASAVGASVVPSTLAVRPPAPPPRTLWALVVSMVYLAVVLLVVPTGDISTAISTVRALPGATPHQGLIASQQPMILPWGDVQDSFPIPDALGGGVSHTPRRRSTGTRGDGACGADLSDPEAD